MLEALTETMINYFSKDPYTDDFARAKEIYLKLAGVMVEEHAYFDTWISGFFEWFLIDYKMKKLGVPPIYLYQRIFSEKLTPEELNFLEETEKCEIELFEIQSVSGQKIKAYNMFKKTSLDFESHENTALLKKGDYLVTRILLTPNQSRSFGVVWDFSNEIEAIVNKKISQIKNELDQENFIFELIKKKAQSEIYSHVPMEQIFGWTMDPHEKILRK